MMREKQKDMRYRRTQRSLSEALIALLAEKPIDKISVRELAERADINRATFYLHYDSPYALLASLENQLFDTIIASYQKNAADNPAVFFSTVFQSIREHEALSKALLHPNTAHDFWEKLGSALRDYYTGHLLPDPSPYPQPDLDYYLSFVKDGYVSIVKHWIAGGMQESPEYMTDISRRFLSRVRIDELLR